METDGGPETVISTRKSLTHLRQLWEGHTQHNPINLSAVLSGSNSIVSQFAFLFALGRHRPVGVASQKKVSGTT
jgi:hypothetical protein